MKERDERILDVYTSKARADKAIHSLKGILLGINLDGEVNQPEVNELERWAKSYNDLILRNPFNEFMNIIIETIEGRMPPKETFEDLYWLTQKYESDNYYFDVVTTDIQTLHGICHGILADGIVNEREVLELHGWLQNNDHLNTYYPYDEIRSLVLSIVSDKRIDEDEKLVLKAYFSQFVRLKNENVQKQIEDDIIHMDIAGLCTSDPMVIFEGKTFCVTGVLKRGSREDLQKEINALGGCTSENVTLKTDYLIVGDNGNRAWAFSCYGRKVEKAINLRKEGHRIVLIHELDLIDILEEMK